MFEHPLQDRGTRKEQEAQQQFIDDAIHDNAYRYSAAAQKMLAVFRRENSDALVDWIAFDTAQDFLSHANDNLRRLILSRCALLALSASLPKNETKKGLLTMLAHACWQLTHFNTAPDPEPQKQQSERPKKVSV